MAKNNKSNSAKNSTVKKNKNSSATENKNNPVENVRPNIPSFIPEAEPAETTPFTEEEIKMPFGETPPNETISENTNEERKRGRGRPKGSKNRNMPASDGEPTEAYEEATKEDKEAARSLMVGAANTIITALSKINFQGRQLFTGELISEQEGKTLGNSFINAYPNVRPNPKLAFWALFMGTVSKRKI